ncbi:MAG: tetratricopeptide repeat protein, partial [Gemmatimonadales bacterium]
TDHRADIYAVGALAYEMLCGRPPFTGTSPQAVMAAHVADVPEPVTKHRPAVSEPLNALVMRCLEKKAADRWQNATELLPQLEGMTTPSGGLTPTGTVPVAAVDYESAARQAHPVRVAALFGVAAAVVLGLVYLVMIQLGLPDWVFLGAIALLAIGLPIMLVTGHHERQRALVRTTGVVVTTPASGVRRWFTWRKSLIGGGLAFAGLGVIATVYMVMRALGVGPAGTLVTTGVLEERDRLLVADFEDRTGDAELGTSVTEALRIDLSQSPVVRVVEAAEVSDVLRRMSRDPGTTLDAELAREVAQREGLKAIVTGDIGGLGSGYVVSARLLATTDGSALVALRETADDAAGIIDAVDRLSSKLRERIGESLRTIRSTPPMGRVSTSSLAALRKYSQGLRADQKGEIQRAALLLDEAIAEDTTFAMAYRALASVLGSVGAEIPRVRAAATRAYEYRDNLPALERYLTEGWYYSTVEFDRSRASAAYRSALEVDPEDVTALSGLAAIALSTRRWAEAESLSVQAMPLTSGWEPHIYGVRAQMAQGKVAEARATIDLYDQKVPGSLDVIWLRSRVHAAVRDYDSAETYARAFEQATDDPFMQTAAAFLLGSIHWVRGRLDAAARPLERHRVAAARRGDARAYLDATLELAYIELRMRERAAQAVRIVDEALSRFPLDSIPPVGRPYPGLVAFYANAGEIDRAKQLLDEYNRLIPDGVKRLDEFRHGAAAAIARAEGRLQEAIDGYRAWDEEAGCVACALFDLAQTYDLMGNTDSALTIFERAVEAPALEKVYQEYWVLGQTYKRLGELYEERGESERAVEYYDRFVELWKDADEELQPLVRDVRGRIAKLVGER